MAKPVMDTTMIKNENGTVTVPLYSRDGWHVGDATFPSDTSDAFQTFMKYNEGVLGETLGNVTRLTLYPKYQ
jgi:hypothetical protein